MTLSNSSLSRTIGAVSLALVYSAVTLSALVTNARARALYERKGFGGEYIRYVLPLKEE